MEVASYTKEFVRKTLTDSLIVDLDLHRSTIVAVEKHKRAKASS